MGIEVCHDSQICPICLRLSWATAALRDVFVLCSKVVMRRWYDAKDLPRLTSIKMGHNAVTGSRYDMESTLVMKSIWMIPVFH